MAVSQPREQAVPSAPSKEVFQKQAESTEALVTRLADRGLDVGDKDRAARYVRQIGYYRLSGYLEFFEDQPRKQDQTREHSLRDGVHLDQVIAIYVFDRKLRLLITEALERVEVALRSEWSNALVEHTKDPHAWLCSNHFRRSGRYSAQDRSDHAISQLKSSCSNNLAIQHYYNHYTDPPHPPTWVMVEQLSFGELSHWFEGTRIPEVRRSVALKFNLGTPALASETFAALTYIRNLCAHHAQCWNKLMLKEPPLLDRLRDDYVYFTDKSRVIKPDRHIYNYLVVLAFILNHLNPKSTWRARLVALVAERTPDQLKRMAFPADWHQRNVWVNPPREPAAVSGLEASLRDALRRHAAAEGVTVADAHAALLRAALLPVTTA